jgi:hypothetical protein
MSFATLHHDDWRSEQQAPDREGRQPGEKAADQLRSPGRFTPEIGAQIGITPKSPQGERHLWPDFGDNSDAPGRGSVTELMAPLYEREFRGKPWHAHFLILSDYRAFSACALCDSVIPTSLPPTTDADTLIHPAADRGTHSLV